MKGKDTENYNEVLVTYNKSEFAVSYEGRHWLKGTAAPADITKSSVTLKMLFKNLQQGKPYNFQVRAVGTGGTSEWSAILVWSPRADPGASEEEPPVVNP